MTTHKVGIIMNGVTGRMGTNQHLIRSILAIREQGGVPLKSGDTIMPEPLLVGRQENKLKALAQTHGLEHWTTDLDEALQNPFYSIYFDAQTTLMRYESVKRAIAHGKHIYCEKPVSTTVDEALELARLAKEAGVKTGVVQDKLFLPGLLKLRRLIDSGYFGRIFAVRMEFGYWVFEGDIQPAQRPSWNYRKEEGGGIVADMFPHWRYVLDDLFGEVRRVSAVAVTHIPQRVDERGEMYQTTADDAVYATFELAGGVMVQCNASWEVRVRRDDLLTIQVDGTEGSAVAGLRDCVVQHRMTTPKAVWNPDLPNPHAFLEQWENVPDNRVFENGFKVEWEHFLRHVVADEPFRWDLLEGAKGVQMAELGLRSSAERRWVDIPKLEV